MDHIVWTKALQNRERIASELISKNEAISAKELWISGDFHPSARFALQELNWKLTEKPCKKLY